MILGVTSMHTSRRWEQLYRVYFGLLTRLPSSRRTQQGLLANFQTHLMFGTAVFHAYVHEWACQIVYNPRYNNYWGLSDGEGLEQLWSFLSALVAVLWTSTRLHRFWALHWRCEFYNGKQKLTSGMYISRIWKHLKLIHLTVTGQWLVSKFKNSHQVKSDASQGLSDIYKQRNPYKPNRECYSAEFLKEQWALERNAQASKKQAEEKQQLKLGRLFCLEEELHHLWYVGMWYLQIDINFRLYKQTFWNPQEWGRSYRWVWAITCKKVERASRKDCKSAK